MIKQILIGIFIILIVLVCTVLIRTFISNNKVTSHEAKPLQLEGEFGKELMRFSGGIAIPTVSNRNYEAMDFEPFIRFGEYLEEAYPLIFRKLQHHRVNKYGIVLRWQGSNSSLKPLLFLSHYDVVPPGEDTDETQRKHLTDTTGVFQVADTPLPALDSVTATWKYSPFSGAVTDGRIYGRGTLDMKNLLFSLLEASDKLIEENFTPARDIYFAFGFDEEVGGLQGAAKIARYFKEKGLQFEAVYDEGGVVAAAGTAGIMQDVALIGVAEKGKSSLEITVRGQGGHSSMPPRHTALGDAARIIEQLENNQMKATLIRPVQDFLQNVSGGMPFTTRMAIANQWLLKPLLIRGLAKDPVTNAMVRTTTAVTMAKGSDAANVLPSTAEVVVNFRILPGNTVEEVRKHVENQCEGYQVSIRSLGDAEPTLVSPTDSKGYEQLVKAIREVYPEALITPYLTMGATDARKYDNLSKNVYRFMPVLLTTADQGTIHNTNEFITVDNYKRMIYFYYTFIRNFD
ncbi:M20/M25/M40 family metallo-hydrolase [Parabacteroides pacaensis]|uniref:M20/M25/M40 family metallo-hydrolase n=1 Tax=Parabacteroides pacaensis TaxID=2086575 RepID=UPI0018FE80E6|nr:M20/M25/M40 family metallo-hydrolase [Parabacteroides pacaensis]